MAGVCEGQPVPCACVCVVLGMEPSAWCMLGGHCTTELRPQSFSLFIKISLSRTGWAQTQLPGCTITPGQLVLLMLCRIVWGVALRGDEDLGVPVPLLAQPGHLEPSRNLSSLPAHPTILLPAVEALWSMLPSPSQKPDHCLSASVSPVP